VINWRRSSVASLSHWASTFVYNNMNLRQRIVRICLRQLRLVYCPILCRLSNPLHRHSVAKFRRNYH